MGWLGPSDLTHQNQVCSQVPSVVLCVTNNNIFTRRYIISRLNLFLDFSCLYMFLILYYNLCFNGSPYYTSTYYNYKSVSPNNIVGHIQILMAQWHWLIVQLSAQLLHPFSIYVRMAPRYMYGPYMQHQTSQGTFP